LLYLLFDCESCFSFRYIKLHLMPLSSFDFDFAFHFDLFPFALYLRCSCFAIINIDYRQLSSSSSSSSSVPKSKRATNREGQREREKERASFTSADKRFMLSAFCTLCSLLLSSTGSLCQFSLFACDVGPTSPYRCPLPPTCRRPRCTVVKTARIV